MASTTDAAYLRRSSQHVGNAGDMSREGQLTEIRRLAAVDGQTGELEVYVDWGKSAAYDKRSKRTDFTRLLADMAAGKIGPCTHTPTTGSTDPRRTTSGSAKRRPLTRSGSWSGPDPWRSTRPTRRSCSRS